MRDKKYVLNQIFLVQVPNGLSQIKYNISKITKVIAIFNFHCIFIFCLMVSV